MAATPPYGNPGLTVGPKTVAQGIRRPSGATPATAWERRAFPLASCRPRRRQVHGAEGYGDLDAIAKMLVPSQGFRMIIFGIDPGSRKTGWGAIRVEGSRLICLGHGTIRVPDKLPLSQRLTEIHAGLREKLVSVSPDQVVLESIFHHKSAKSALVLGHARGVALLAAGQQNVPIIELSPSEVKKAVSGSGRADKHQVQHMVKALLGLPAVAAEDASDALAVAIAGSARRQFAAAAGLGARR